MNRQKVYLAGGMHSDWRDDLKSSVNIDFIDPSKKESGNKLSVKEYGVWDLHHIDQCDIVFVYIEKTNPSGYGLSVEAGYAKGKGKTVILCMEPGHDKHSYLRFIENVSDIVFTDIQKAVSYLKLFT
jgi:nucleoside 2-deoxyribosyltransferase